MAATTSRGSSSRSGPRERSSSNGSRASDPARATTRGRAQGAGSKPASTTNANGTSADSSKSSGSSPQASSGSRSETSSSGTSRKSPAGARSSGTSRKPPSARARKTDAHRSHESSASTNASEDGQGDTRQTITKIVAPIATAALGVAGGVVLGRTALQRTKKVLGIPLPGTKVNLAGVTKQLGEAGRQFGKLAGEVRTAREKAEKISRALS